MLYDYHSQIMTPAQRRCLGLAVRKTAGRVTGAEHLLTDTSAAAVLEYETEEPVVILDMGPASPGGYPVFRVKAAEGPAVVRVSYADFWLPMSEADNAAGRNGDFVRGCCKYLGVELPVLPANPGRFELYTVTGGETYTSPLIQGQQRFVRLSLEHPGSRVEIETFYIHYTSDMSPIDGGFFSDNAALNKLWYASVYTFQLASLTHPAWDTLDGWLFPRALTKGNDAGILRAMTGAADYVFSFTARISWNPYAVSGVGFTFRAPDQDNGYVVRLDLDGGLSVYKRVDRVYHELKPRTMIPPLTDNTDIPIEVRVEGDRFTTSVNGQMVDVTVDGTFPTGSVGFCQQPEKWSMVKELRVRTLEGDALFTDDFDNGLDAYQYTTTPPFVADGAKRDRLPWSGDLDWAGRNNYYSMREYKYMKGALDILALHQTDEGFVFGTCYPENTVRPENRSYGYYESDIFSAWFVPVAADYLLYTGDREAMVRFYPAAKRDVEYLWRFVEGDGVFNQRYETSKGLWDHMLGDYGRNGYNNLIVYDAICEAAFMARHLGFAGEAERFAAMAATMKRGIAAKLVDPREGWIVKSESNRDFCYMSNSYALAVGFFDGDTARRVMHKLMQIMPEHGKVLSTNIRGAYRYGMEKEGYEQLTRYHEIHFDWGYDTGITWTRQLEDDDVPHTTYECMFYPRSFDPDGTNWGDMSHPDTAMAHILTGCILGVQPLTPGYRTFEIRPQTYGFKQAAGLVPLPDGGAVELDLRDEGDRYTVQLLLDCRDQHGRLLLPLRGEGGVYIDGKPVDCAKEEERAVIELDQHGSGLYESR